MHRAGLPSTLDWLQFCVDCDREMVIIKSFWFCWLYTQVYPAMQWFGLHSPIVRWVLNQSLTLSHSCTPEKARFLLARSGSSEKSRGVVGLGPRVVSSLSRLTTDAVGQLDVLGQDGDTLGMDGAQVGVLKETHKVSLAFAIVVRVKVSLWTRERKRMLNWPPVWAFIQCGCEGEAGQVLIGLLILAKLSGPMRGRERRWIPLYTQQSSNLYYHKVSHQESADLTHHKVSPYPQMHLIGWLNSSVGHVVTWSISRSDRKFCTDLNLLSVANVCTIFPTLNTLLHGPSMTLSTTWALLQSNFRPRAAFVDFFLLPKVFIDPPPPPIHSLSLSFEIISSHKD